MGTADETVALRRADGWPLDCHSSLLLRGNDVRRRRDRVEVIHQRSAMLQYGALIDRAFIGDLADVERGRLVNQDHSADACGTTGALSRMRVQATLKLLSYTLVTEHVDRSGIYREPRNVGSACIEIGKDERRNFVAIGPRQHDVTRERSELVEKSHA